MSSISVRMNGLQIKQSKNNLKSMVTKLKEAMVTPLTGNKVKT